MMIREYIVEIDDSLKGADADIDELEMKWGAEELPKGHGRLIDADALQKTYHDDVFIENYTFGEDGHRKMFVNTAISVIELAPTVIEADKGNK